MKDILQSEPAGQSEPVESPTAKNLVPQGIGMAVAFDWGLTVQLLAGPLLPLVLRNLTGSGFVQLPTSMLKLSPVPAAVVTFLISLPFAAGIAIFGEGIRRGWRWTRPVQIVFNTLLVLLPSQASLNVKRPSRTSRVLNTICTGRVQRQPRRMPSPKMAMPAAKGREMRNVTTAAGTGLNFSIDVGSCTNPDPVRLRKTKGRRGPASSCTVKPQSKATAMPMPWGTRFFAVGDSTGSDWPAGSDCRMSFIVISPALVSLWCYLATYQICVLEGMSREGGHKDPTPL